MLGNAAPTPYDLRFSLFGIPVRVHPLFWLVSVAFGWHGKYYQLTAISVASVFVSILVHELGHALTQRYFRENPEIVLYMLGGYAASYSIWGRRSTSRSILISFAGPAAGFVLFAIVFGVHLWLKNEGAKLSFNVEWAFARLEFFNLWWGLVNLLPVYPLDGGQISSAAFSHWRPYDGEQLALKLSLVTAIGVVVFAFQQQQTFVAILFASLAFENFNSLQGGGRFR